MLPALEEAADPAEEPLFPLQAAIVAAIIRAARAKAIFFILFSPLLYKLCPRRGHALKLLARGPDHLTV